MAFFGVDDQVRIDELNHQFKNVIRTKGEKGAGLRYLINAFKQFDANCNGKLELREFEEALASYGLFPK
jgi:Ca2+-binding EF-hand superfamily protein